MAAGREIHGEVVLDVQVGGEEKAKARLQEAFAKLEAKVNVNATFKRQQIQAALDVESKKGRGLRVSVDAVFSRSQMQADIKEKAAGGSGLKARVDAQFSRPQVQRSIKEALAAKPPRITVAVDVKRGAYTAVVAEAKAAQREITSFELKEQEKRRTADAKSNAKTRADRIKGEQDRETIRTRSLKRLDILEAEHSNRLVQFEAAAAQRIEVIQAQARARQDAANHAFDLRRVAAQERQQAALQKQADKPILQRILVNTDQVNSSLADFDRTVSRALKTSLTAFSVYSAGVVVSLAAIGVAAESSFAKFELAATRAAGVSASSKINDQVAKTGHALHSFAVQLDADRTLIEKRAIQVSLQTIGFDPTEISTGIQNLVQAGQTLPDALNNIGIAAKFAQINGDTLDDTTNNLAAAMAAAGLKSKDTAKFLDQVQLSSQNALGGAGDFLEALANGASAAARAFGQTNTDALVLVQLLANTGITGREAGTQGSIVFREFNKVIGQSADQLKKANVDTTTFGSSVVGIAKAFDDAKKSGKNVFQFGKDLGFTQKSIRSIINILPQLQDLGTNGFQNLAKQAQSATGIVEEQAQGQRRTVAAQFDNLGDTVKGLANIFGNAASGQVRDFFDVFAGDGGLLNQSSKAVTKFGERFGEVVGKAFDFVQTGDFRAGIQNLVDAVSVTVGGVADSFRQFAAAFNHGKETTNTFVALTAAIKAFSQLAADVLPRVARIIGEIVNFLIEHRNSFEFFAKLTLGIYAVRKAYSLLIKPVGQAAIVLNNASNAIKLAADTGAGGALTNALAQIAGKFGLVNVQAKAATDAVAGFTAAETIAGATALPGTSKGRSTAVAEGRRGVTGDQVAAQAVGVATLFNPKAGLDRVFKGAAIEKDAASVTRLGAAFDKATASTGKFSAVFAKLVPEFIRLAPVIGPIAEGLAKLAGPIGLAIGAIQLGISAVKGFRDQFRSLKNDADPSTLDAFKQGLHGLGVAASEIGKFVVFLAKLLSDAIEKVGRGIGQKIANQVFNFILLIGEAIKVVEGVAHAVEASFDFVENKIGNFIGSIERTMAHFAGTLGALPGGGKFREIADSLNAAADAADNWGERTKAAADKSTLAQRDVTFTAAQAAAANRTNAAIATLVGEAQAQAATHAKGSVVLLKQATDNANTATQSFGLTVGGLTPTFAGLETNAVRAMTAIGDSAEHAQSQLLAVQAALQASLGQSANATNSIIQSQLQQQLANAKAGVGAISVAQAQAAIANEREAERQARLVASAKRAKRDASIIDSALGSGVTPGNKKTTTPAAAKAAPERQFVDPDVAIQAAIDRLKPVQRIAQTNALITKVTSDAGKSYQLTRKDTLLLAEALPQVDKAVEAQKAKVDKLSTALENLRNVQLLGTKAASDAAFAFDEQQKALQLQQVNLKLAGATDTDPRIVALQKQIDQISLQAQQADLTSALQLDPLKKKLEETFQPVKELSFDDIVAQFDKLSKAQGIQQAALVSQEAVQAKLNARLDAAKTKYDRIDEAAQASVTAFNNSQKAAAGTATAISDVSTSAASGAKTVTKFSTAVENVPSGKGVVDKALKGIGTRVTELAPLFTNVGTRVITLITRGLNIGRDGILEPALARIVGEIPTYLNAALSPVTTAGTNLMHGFYLGMVEGFGADKKPKFSPAWFLNVYIPEWIKANKGPVSYDATILVPAGHAVMEGFGSGLKSGFAQIQSFVKDVGPSLSEFVSTDLFSNRTATIMADIALGKKPDINAALADLAPGALNVGSSGPVDASLGFLHKTLSLSDTAKMAQGLAKLFHLQVTALRDNHSFFTASGNVSDHAKGLAADLSNSSGGGDDPRSNTPEMLALATALEPLQGKIIKQLIYQNRDRATGAFIGGHQNHDHVAFLPGKGFSADSGKFGQPAIPNIPGASDRIDAAIAAASQRFGVEEALLAAIAKQESGFNPNARSPAGALGLFQFIPSTAAGFHIDPLNIEQAAEGGARFLKNLLGEFGGRYDFAMAGYNAGPGAVEKYHGVPPFAETRNYVHQVTKNLEEFRKQFGGFREAGGPVQAGRSYVVGEKRPEIFVPRSNGTILPDARATLSGSSSPTYQDNRTIHNEVHTNATDAEAVADVLEARTRSSMTGVNFR